MEEKVKLDQLFKILKKRLGILLIFSFLGVSVAGVMTFFVIKPVYSSQAQLVVTLPKTETNNGNDVNTNLQMINTYKDFITSDLVLKQLIDELESNYHLHMKAKKLKKIIEVKQNQNSQMFSIIAEMETPQKAEQIANTIAKLFKNNAKDVLNIDRITILSAGEVDNVPVSPSHKLNLAIGLAAGIIIGVTAVFGIELFDRTIKDSDFVVDDLGFTILGTISELSNKEVTSALDKVKHLSREQTSTSMATEAFQPRAAGRRNRNRI